LIKKRWMVKACMEKDYHYELAWKKITTMAHPREYAYTRLGAWLKSLKYRKGYNLVKIERMI